MNKRKYKIVLFLSMFLLFFPLTTQAATTENGNIKVEESYSPFAEFIGTGKKRSFIRENYVNGSWVLEHENIYEWVEIRFENGFDRTYNNYDERVYYDANTDQPVYRTYYRTYYYSFY